MPCLQILLDENIRENSKVFVNQAKAYPLITFFKVSKKRQLSQKSNFIKTPQNQLKSGSPPPSKSICILSGVVVTCSQALLGGPDRRLVWWGLRLSPVILC